MWKAFPESFREKVKTFFGTKIFDNHNVCELRCTIKCVNIFNTEYRDFTVSMIILVVKKN